MARKRLAIVSSYNESCGNASYAHVLKNGFSQHVDCEVIPLDLFLLQKTSSAFSAAGDRHIREIAERLKEFDYVNIQFEAALYGAGNAQVLRRFKILLKACRSVVVTMHRIDPPAFHVPHLFRSFGESVLAGHPIVAIRKFLIEVFHNRGLEHLYGDIIDVCRRRARNANVWVLVHTKRERRVVQEIYGFDQVVDYPITFLTEEQRRDVLTRTDREGFRRRHDVPEGVKVMGAFGFISAYKGYETLIEALRLLPEEYHLYIFGGQHPGAIAQEVKFDPYIESLVELIEEKNEQVVNDLRRRLIPYVKSKSQGAVASAELAEDLEAAYQRSIRYDIGKRVHFVGELSDPDFIEALRACDAVVLPYLEVGQSMSGVIALGIECGANLYCARNKSFAEVMRYYGEVFVSFDIGNFVELSQKILRGENRYEQARDRALSRYNLRNNVALHLQKMGFAMPVDAAELQSAAGE